MKKLKRIFFLVAYYYFARLLPEHQMPRGMLFAKLREWTARPLLRHCGKNVGINRNAHFGRGDQFSLGDNSSLGYNARIVGDVSLGNDVGLAHNVFITASGRKFDGTDMPIVFQGKTEDDPVVVEDNCIIFAEVIILPGVRIHSGSVIGAGAVVSRDVPPNSIVAGNPARVVKFRVAPPPGADYTGMTPIACKMPTAPE